MFLLVGNLFIVIFFKDFLVKLAAEQDREVSIEQTGIALLKCD